MQDFGKLLIALGILLVFFGLCVELCSRFLPLGHLPGDIHFSGEHGDFYFPVVTCIVLSIVLSIVANIFHR